MIVVFEKGGQKYFKFKAKDIDLLLPALYEEKFKEVTEEMEE